MYQRCFLCDFKSVSESVLQRHLKSFHKRNIQLTKNKQNKPLKEINKTPATLEHLAIRIYCDGSCSPNPGQGGYAAILKYKHYVKEISGYWERTTNNRMELFAAIVALEELKKPNSTVVVTSDSQYLVNGMNSWLKSWIKNGWKTKNRDVINRDLWERLLLLSKKHSITWRWVRGHSYHPENERCDYLAKEAIKNLHGVNRYC